MVAAPRHANALDRLLPNQPSAGDKINIMNEIIHMKAGLYS